MLRAYALDPHARVVELGDALRDVFAAELARLAALLPGDVDARIEVHRRYTAGYTAGSPRWRRARVTPSRDALDAAHGACRTAQLTRRSTMKKTKKLSFNRETIRALTLSTMNRVVGGISGQKGCNYSENGNCGDTAETCPISGLGCPTGQPCNSLACSEACPTWTCP